jgi:hypothetical protein
MANVSDEVYALVRTFRTNAASGTLSRNRNFEAHATAEARAARRILRFVRGIETDVLRAEQIVVRPTRDGVALELSMPALKLRRTVELDSGTLAILVENEACAARLSGTAGAVPREAA